MKSTGLLLALAVAGPSGAALTRAASDRAISLHWNRASQRIIRDAQEKIALGEAGQPPFDRRFPA
jgi:hypothetical protein